MRVGALLSSAVLVVLLAACSNSSNQDKTIRQLQATIAAQQRQTSPQPQQPATPTITSGLYLVTPAAPPISATPAASTAPTALPATAPATNRPASPAASATPPTRAATAGAPRATDQFSIGVAGYQTFDLGNGRSLGLAQLYFLNQTAAPIPARTLDIKQIVIDSAEGNTVNGNYKVLYHTDLRYAYTAELQNLFQMELSDPQLNLADLGAYDLPLGVENTFEAQKNQQGRQVRIPAGVPFKNIGYDIDNHVVVGFLFGSTTHPTHMHIMEHDATTYEMSFSDSGIYPNGYVPSADVSRLQIHPLAELAARTFETADATLRFRGTCVTQDNQPALPITIANRSSSARAEGTFTLPFAAYFPDGIVAFDGRGLRYTLGPGEKTDTFDGIDRALADSLPSPSLITIYDPTGVATTYQMDCKRG